MSPPHNVYSCFRPSGDDNRRASSTPSPQATVSGDLNSTTCLYQTHLGLFTLSWSRTFLGHSLNIHLASSGHCFRSPLSFDLHVKPVALWRKHGSKKITVSSHTVQVYWDLSRAKIGSGPEPRSGFYVAVLVDREMGLIAGDRHGEAYAKTRVRKQRVRQALVLRREHVLGSRIFGSKARFGGKTREISIDCRTDEDARLCFSVDGRKILQIKRLKWKFRGNERVEIDGAEIQVSWDVYNWLFENNSSNSHKEIKRTSRDGPAVFIFRFENEDLEDEEQKAKEEGREEHEEEKEAEEREDKKSVVTSRMEWRKIKRTFLRSGRSSSFSSMSNFSSASSACSSSVMEWASSADEPELCGRHSYGFSLVLYAWRK